MLNKLELDLSNWLFKLTFRYEPPFVSFVWRFSLLFFMFSFLYMSKTWNENDVTAVHNYTSHSTAVPRVSKSSEKKERKKRKKKDKKKEKQHSRFWIGLIFRLYISQRMLLFYLTVCGIDIDAVFMHHEVHSGITLPPFSANQCTVLRVRNGPMCSMQFVGNQQCETTFRTPHSNNY